jgi:uncharacterized membrane protein HdeD (DUF308 family)
MNDNYEAFPVLVSGILFVLGGAITIASTDLLGSTEPPVGPVTLTAELALGVCAAGFATAAYRPARRGQYREALLHVIAVVGAIAVAVGGSSPMVWAGIVLLGVAGVALTANGLRGWSLEERKATD